MPSDDYIYGVAWDWTGFVGMWTGSFDLPNGLLVSSTHWQYVVDTATNRGDQPPVLSELASSIANATTQNAWLTPQVWAPNGAGAWGTQEGVAQEAQALWTTSFSANIHSPNDSTLDYVVFRAPLTRVGQVRVSATNDNDEIHMLRDASVQDQVNMTLTVPELGGVFYQLGLDVVSDLDIASLAGNDQVILNLTNGPINFSNSLTVDGAAGDDTLMFAQIADNELGQMSSTSMSIGSSAVTSFEGIESLAMEFSGGSATFDSDAQLAGAEVALIVAGDGSAIFDSTEHLDALSVKDAAVVKMSAGLSSVLVTTSLTTDSGAKVDLTDEDLVVDYTGESVINNVLTQIHTGYNPSGQRWRGFGITSSTAAETTTTGLGYAEANEIFSAFPATFSGVSVDGSAVLVKYTYYGDSNLDGQVDVTDLGALATNWQLGEKKWHDGDFNYDQFIDVTDLGLIATNWQAGVNPPSAQSFSDAWNQVRGGGRSSSSDDDGITSEQWDWLLALAGTHAGGTTL